MAPLPMHNNALSTTAHDVVGGSKAALSWPTILAFMSILFAAMQGTLVMESADPCRISFRKLSILFGLEAAEVLVAIVSEVLSFVHLRRALMLRLQWLEFVAPCVLIIGLMGILFDVYYTIKSASNCRVRWIPFSASGHDFGNSTLQNAEMLYLVATTVLSIALIGWRQRWWWIASSVSADSARRASEGNTALSVGVMGFCVGWGFYLSLNALILGLSALRRQDLMSYWYVFHPNSFFDNHDVKQSLATKENTEPLSSQPPSASQPEVFVNCSGNSMMRESTDQPILTGENTELVSSQPPSASQPEVFVNCSGNSMMRESTDQPILTRQNTELERVQPHSASPQEALVIFLKGSSNFFMKRGSMDQLIKQQRILKQLRLGINQDDTDEEALKCQLRIAPLHVGNAIVGNDKDAIYKENENAVIRSYLTVIEHSSTLPLLASVLAAVAQMWDKMDEETFNAMKELADVVIVVAFVEMAKALKSLLWGVSGRSDNDADIPISDNSEWIQSVLREPGVKSGEDEGGDEGKKQD